MERKELIRMARQYANAARRYRLDGLTYSAGLALWCAMRYRQLALIH
jgi:hypothetical protein